MIIHKYSCCGIREINGLEDFSSANEMMVNFIKAALPERRQYNWNWRTHRQRYETIAGLRFSHAIFSEARARGYKENYGEKFAAFIKKHDLGDVASSQRRVNPNSSNQLRVWVWTLNKRNLIKWATANIKDENGTQFKVASVF